MKRFLLPLVAIALAVPAWAQHGTLTVARNLDQLTSRAAVILRGNVVSVRMEKHPELSNLDTVVVTLHVRETLKGQAGKTFTFRQYVWDLRDRMNAVGYKQGQHVLLMMIEPSRYGLSSPVGMEQGRFRIERDDSGRQYAVNSRNNLGLFAGVGAQLAKEGATLAPATTSLLLQHRRGPVELRELTGLIRQLTAGNQ